MSVDYYVLVFTSFVIVVGMIRAIYFVGKGRNKQDAFNDFQDKINECGLKVGDNLDNKSKFLKLTK